MYSLNTKQRRVTCGRITQRAGDCRTDPVEYSGISDRGIYRKLPEYHAYAGLWSCLYTNDHSGWRILQTVHLYVSAFGIEHLLNNMLVLFVLGSRLEQVIGKIKFLLIYLIGGVLGNVISLLIEFT